jgi:predicted phosphoribosyltransferase
MRFKDRREAGRVLARVLAPYSGRNDVQVLALPRGGVPVGLEVAQALAAPLDVFVVRKLGVPGHEEFAMGAIASGGVRVMNDDVIRGLAIPPDVIDRVTAKEAFELQRREREYRGNRPPLAVEGTIVILVDDGLATGASMRAAATALRQLRPSKLVVATPVGDSSTCNEMRQLADEVFCAYLPDAFQAVGLWYEDFSETSDDEVRDLLFRACGSTAKPPLDGL